MPNMMSFFKMIRIIRKKLKIFYSIIVFNSVNMVNNLFREKVSTDMRFRNKTTSANISTYPTKRVLGSVKINIPFRNRLPVIPSIYLSLVSLANLFSGFFRWVITNSSSSFNNDSFIHFGIPLLPTPISDLPDHSLTSTSARTKFSIMTFIANKFRTTQQTRFCHHVTASFFIIITYILFLSTTNADAQTKWIKFSYFENKLGLNDNLSTTEIDDKEATDIQNVIFDTGGAIRKRYGYTSLPIGVKVATGATVCVNGITFYEKADGTQQLVALANNDGHPWLMRKEYSAGPVGGNWFDINNGIFDSITYTNNTKPDFAVAEDKLLFTVGGTVAGSTYPRAPYRIYQYTGGASASVLVTSGFEASGTILEYHKNQMFLAGNPDWPSRVSYSNLDDISTWTPTDFFDVQTSDGSNVTALVSAFDSLYIFKNNSIWRLSGAERDSFQLQEMVSGIGTSSNDSVQVVNNYIYFTTAQNDIAIYDGAYTCQFISQKIRGTIGGLDFDRSAQNVGLAYSTYKYNDYDYYVAVTEKGGTGNNRILLFDTQYKAWTKFKGMNANAMCVAPTQTGQDAMFFGDYNGYVHIYPSNKYYDGDEASTAIAAIYQTKWFKYSDICLGDKYWRLLKTYTLAADNTILYAECKSDYESSGKVFALNLGGPQDKWDVAMWDLALWGGESIVVGRNEVDKGTSMFQLRYTQESNNTGFTILGFENFVEPAERI